MSKRSKKGLGRKARLRMAVASAPVWLATVQIAKRAGKRRIRGTFGAASPVRHLKPEDLA